MTDNREAAGAALLQAQAPLSRGPETASRSGIGPGMNLADAKLIGYLDIPEARTWAASVAIAADPTQVARALWRNRLRSVVQKYGMREYLTVRRTAALPPSWPPLCSAHTNSGLPPASSPWPLFSWPFRLPPWPRSSSWWRHARSPATARNPL